MIAILELQWGGQPHKVSLDDDGLWRCANELLEKSLRAFFDPFAKHGPQYGEFGVAAVQAAIDQYAGRELYRKPIAVRPDRVY